MPDISKQLLQLRKELKLTQRQLADKVGVYKNTISRIERGIVFPDETTLKKFANKGINLNLKNTSESKEGKVILTFNIENEFFHLYYFSHKEESSLKNTSQTTTYSLTLTMEIDKLLEFLAVKYPSQAKNTQIQNVTEASLSITSTKTEYLYLLTIKGDTVGMVKFKPSKFEDTFEEDKKEEEVVEEKEMSQIPTKKHISTLDVYLRDDSVAVNYNEYHYSDRKGSSTYRLCLDRCFTEYFIEVLKRNNLYNQDRKITDAYLDVYFKTPLSVVTLFGENLFEKIELPLTELIDLDETHNIPEFLRPIENEEEIYDKPLIPIPKLLQSDLPKIDSTMEHDVVILYKKLIQTRDQYDSTLEQIKRLVVDKVTRKNPQVREYICKVYKQEIENDKYLEVGTVNEKNEVAFYVPKQSEDSFQGKWHSYYSKVFIKQTTWIYEDGTEELGTGYEFTPSNKIQEIESSDRKGVIGYVEHKAGIVEVIYYDRFVN